MAHFHKVNVTYHAPEGDNKVVEMMNTTFFDGQPVDVICTMEDEARIENNPHFQINSSTDYDPGDQPPPPPEGDAARGARGAQPGYQPGRDQGRDDRAKDHKR